MDIAAIASRGGGILCPNTLGVGVNRPGAWAEFVAIPQENCWHADPSIPLDVLSCFDPLGNAVHTALSFDLVGEDVLITGAGPIGCMAIPICKRAGARHAVITDVNPYRLNLARIMGADLALDVRTEKLAGAMQKLGMKEGFDVALEMSGNPKAFADILPNMFHGGKIALLGIMPGSAAIDWNTVVFSALTIKGVYGREMYETWYKMTAMIQSGLDISPGHHAPLSLHRIQGSHRADEIRKFRAKWCSIGANPDFSRRITRIIITCPERVRTVIDQPPIFAYYEPIFRPPYESPI